MSIVNKIDLPQFVKEQLRKQTISPEPQKNRQFNFHRRLTSSQMDTVTPINSNNFKKQTKKQSSNCGFNHHLVQGLQQLLKTSPYSKNLQQQKSYSQTLLHLQDSFSQQYLRDQTSGYTPQQSHFQQNFFKTSVKCQQSQNSTMSSSIKPRMKSANKDLLKTSSVETTKILSNREKDRQAITALQQLLVRTNNILLQYQQEIQRHIEDKKQLAKIIKDLESQQQKQ